MSGNEALRIIGDVEIARLRLAAGDVLVVQATGVRLTDEMAMRIKAHVDRKLPHGVQCLVLDPSIDLTVLTRAEIEAKVA